MGYPVFYPEAGDTLPILFGSYDGGTGASITLTGLAVTDIEIYKDGGTTARASDNGYALLGTDGIDEFGTGIHGISIDLSDNSDAGFYAVGSWYHVVIASVTIDSQTVNFVAASFRILSTTRGMAGTALPDAAADAAGGLPVSDAGGLDMDTMNTNVSSVLTDTAEIGAAGAGLSAVPWNAAWDAEVQSEVQDALDAAHSEPTGVPAANASLATKIGVIFMMMRNKITVTSTKKTFYDDGDAAEFEKDLTDDGTTYTESEANAI